MVRLGHDCSLMCQALGELDIHVKLVATSRMFFLNEYDISLCVDHSCILGWNELDRNFLVIILVWIVFCLDCIRFVFGQYRNKSFALLWDS